VADERAIRVLEDFEKSVHSVVDLVSKYEVDLAAGLKQMEEARLVAVDDIGDLHNEFREANALFEMDLNTHKEETRTDLTKDHDKLLAIVAQAKAIAQAQP
jgi:hypothetical protein